MENKTRKTKGSESRLERALSLWLETKGFLKWMEIALLLAGLVLLAWYGAARIDAYLTSRTAIKTLEKLDEPPSSANSRLSAGKLAAGDPDFSDWDAGRVRAYKDSVWKRTGAPL